MAKTSNKFIIHTLYIKYIFDEVSKYYMCTNFKSQFPMKMHVVHLKSLKIDDRFRNYKATTK